MEHKSILVVVAHPDDETLGCGATLRRFTSEGSEARVLILSEGLTARDTEVPPETRKALQDACRRACERLGAPGPVLCGLPDNRLDTVPLLALVQTVEAQVDAFDPQLILTHHIGDLNLDHALTHRAVLTATRPMSGRGVAEVWTFETPSSTEWAFGTAQPFAPNMFVDVAQTLDDKLAAMACYDTEAREYPHPRSARALRARAESWGSVSGFEAAEAFMLVRRLLGQSRG
jgi:LmbE family N-acetylglucosaminyl deacetylase